MNRKDEFHGRSTCSVSLQEELRDKERLLEERQEEARLKEGALREEVERAARRLEEERQKVLAAQVWMTFLQLHRTVAMIPYAESHHPFFRTVCVCARP